MPGTHALLSPSGAKRWLSCSRSARYTENIPEEESEYANEGTLAHDLAEWTIKKELGLISEAKFKDEFIRIKKHKHFYKGMPDDVAPYVDFVIEQYAEAKQEDPKAEIFLESQVDLSYWIPESFGTIDCRIVTKWTLRVIDFKFGQGVPVSAVDNDQLKIYSLGSWTLAKETQETAPIKVKMAIVQPRIKDVSTFEMYVKDLLTYGYEVVQPGGKLAHAGGTEFVAGDHCQFCKARATCKTLAAYSLSMIDKTNFSEPHELTDEEIADVVQRAAIFRGWVKAVETYALTKALSGKRWPGMKVVKGRSNRQYKDEDAILQALREAGVDTEDVVKFGLVGITELQRLIGGKKFKAYVEPHLTKEDGAPTLVLESDERPALNSAAEAVKEFGTWEDEEENYEL